MEEKIFNMHTHIFPGKIATKAVEAIGDFYSLPMSGGGTSESLIEDGSKVGVSRYLVCSTATTAHQVHSINDFIKAEVVKYPQFTGFGSLHPDLDDIPAEVDRIIALGLKGIKLHPDFQKFNIDWENAMPIYEAAEGRLPILFHTGDNRYDYSQPRRLLNVLDKFPKLIAIAAHLGGYRRWDEIDVYLQHPRVFIDTSSALAFMTPGEASNIIHRHGTDRVFFGTDTPMWGHEDEMGRFNKLELTAQERADILYNNAARLIDSL